jgi:hypothetical protein
MRLASVTERIGPVSEKLYDGVSCAGAAVSKGAEAAYRTALNYPKTSIGGVILAAALVGGLLWLVFGREEESAARTGSARRVHARTRTARRTRARGARAAAAD